MRYEARLDRDDDERRLDGVVRRRLGAPRGLVMKLIRKGRVRLDGERARDPSIRVAAGQTLTVEGAARALDDYRDSRTTLTPEQRRTIKDRIAFEDEHLIVYDKPAGVVVHAGSGHERGIIDDLVAYAGGEGEGFRPALAHRLDRDTSGLIVLCRTAPALRVFHEAMRARSIDKRYLAIVGGQPEPGTGEITLPLYEKSARGPKRVRVAEASEAGARAAHTRYRTLHRAQTAVGPVSLLELELLTGRRHQLRVHLEAIRHPILGDPRYGPRSLNERCARAGLERMALHASHLRFVHPIGGCPVEVRSKPKDLYGWLGLPES
ncbi:MAG: RluA family pseudouridine synthase [Planctomycetota bacterium]